MYVFNDLTTDARVLREATTLARAGHVVTVVGRRDDAGTPAREERDGFEIVRIPIPPGPHLALLFVRYPARARRQAARWLAASLRRGPRGIVGVVAALAFGLVALGWSAIRVPIDWLAGAVLRVTGRSSMPGADLAEWLARWRWGTLGWARAAAALVPEADIHHGHDLSGLPPAVMAVRQAAGRGGARAIYDSHEIFLESGTNALRPRWIRRRFAAIEQGWIRETVAMVTVNEAVAAELARRYDAPRIVAVHNCPWRWTPPANPEDRIRRATGIPEETPIALYHGAFRPHRGMEQLAEAILEPGLERVHAVFLGYGPERPRLERLAAEERFDGRLHILGPVPAGDVVPWVAGADVDVVAIQPSTLNHLLSTPNKLFEALAAGTPVVAMDFPEVRRIVTGFPAGSLGELCDPTDPRAIAAAIASIVSLPVEAARNLRARCRASADGRWNWETEGARLVELYAELASTSGPAADPPVS
jgi:glycosyltransferase involved in cell wall biosynthesis